VTTVEYASQSIGFSRWIVRLPSQATIIRTANWHALDHRQSHAESQSPAAVSHFSEQLAANDAGHIFRLALGEEFVDSTQLVSS
jgi:hypothetical protein